MRRTTRLERAGDDLVECPRAGVGPPRPSRIGPREPRAAPAAQGVKTDDEASAPPDPRPAVLDRVGQHVAAMAHRIADRPTGDSDAMASRLASPPMDSPFDADAVGSGTNRWRDPYAGRQDGVGQPVMGRTAHSWRISQIGVDVSERTVSRLVGCVNSTRIE